MFKYLSPREATSVLAVKMEKYGFKISMPIITKKLQLINDKTNPLNAVEDAFSESFAPKAFAIIILVPAPVPDATAVIKVCTGNARDKAVRPLPS
ncbi:hypothetical protein K030075H31_05080 [Blautia producta]